MSRRQPYPPASYSNQDIPLQYRQGYPSNGSNTQLDNNNLQTPVNAYQGGRSRPPDNHYEDYSQNDQYQSPRNVRSPTSPSNPMQSPTYNTGHLQVNNSYNQQRPSQPNQQRTPQNSNNYYQGSNSQRNNSVNASSSNSEHITAGGPYRQNSANSSSSNVRSPTYLSPSNVQASSSSSAPSTLSKGRNPQRRPSISATEVSTIEKYNISPTSSHHLWDEDPNTREADDDLHNPEAVMKGKDRECVWCSKRGCLNVGALVVIIFGILGLFAAYPVYNAIRNGGKTNSTATSTAHAKRSLSSPVYLVDPDTPSTVRTKRASDGTIYKLVFSDEFNEDGRSFRPGNDPHWEALDRRSESKNDLAWDHPDAITTKNGSLQITITKQNSHNFEHTSGITSWNKFCFQGGILEVSVSLPGSNRASGLKSAVWTTGNFAQAGHDAINDGTGRGAPKINVLEGFTDHNHDGKVTQSAALFDANEHFNINHVTSINKNVYDGNAFEKYSFDYEPGVSGHMNWFVDDKVTLKLNANSMRLNPKFGLGQQLFSNEPMLIGISLDIESHIGIENLTLPATMHVDYVRVYQDLSKIKTSC